ncbi:RNA polymerase factor sigma-54 [Tissierella sp. Yu-01]|uniref:RNA polymerase factor sigma-54 n=1 Tax=Tissierella sp. Yu-01 TaxID=3035694 RepID=UPI00240E6B73|nr:RNA polymerase factor sigma-54 [Tissierella sp. Yu-01]WFA10206.1 RNA polymerase factor sigma-54 [Tissierella sp. Yu-01]
MKLSYNLNLEQTQKLIMTPELRQAIQLLQYNSLELNEYLSMELQENPMLEMENPPAGDLESLTIDTKEPEIDWKEFIEKYDDISYKQQIDRNEKEHNIEAYISYDPTLREHLMSQLSLLKIAELDFKIAEYLINNIDDNGYLIIPTEEIAKLTKVSEQKVEDVLNIVQTFEPTGVGARSLKECLLLQLEESTDDVIKKLITNHLEDIANNRLIKIAKENDLSPIIVQDICDFIKTLEPKPGRMFKSNSDIKYIIPDATIQLVDDEYIIIINDITGPRLKINNFYKNMLKDGGDVKATDYLQDKFNSAMWIIKSIEQRRQTIYKVVESILKFQYDFFKVGEKALVPLTLKDIAEDIQMHESTISRATNGKYVQTPRGLFELKYFFTAGLSSAQGDVSSTSVKVMIKDIIDKENVKKPLSDQQISNILKDKGTNISRRTVAKYREELNIPASNLRKRI